MENIPPRMNEYPALQRKSAATSPIRIFSSRLNDPVVMDPSSTLISPPPEDLLQKHAKTPGTGSIDLSPIVYKRKRPPPSPYASNSSLEQAVPTTPNPQPRKQSKRHDPQESPLKFKSPTPNTSLTGPSFSKRTLLLSPHSANPNADFIPPVSTHSRHLLAAKNRRSITPIPPYEPPREKFTPPVEIIGNPIGGKFTERKQPTKKTGKQLKLVIKEEPPDIDLSLPAPPASPTEDPLLLAGPSKRSGSKSVLPLRLPVPSTSSPGNDGDVVINYIANTSDSFTSNDDQPRADDIIFPAGEWSDSDDGEDIFNQTGEFTGKFTTIRVPTKEDPPTSITKDRQEAWGRPVSPFPFPTRRQSRWSSPLEPPRSSSPSEHDSPDSDGDDDYMHVEEDNSMSQSAIPDPPGVASGAAYPDVKPLQQSLAHETAVQQQLLKSNVLPMFDFSGISSQRQELVLSEKAHESPVTTLLSETKIPQELFQREKSVAEEEEEEEQHVDRELSQGLHDDDLVYHYEQSLRAPKFNMPTPTPFVDIEGKTNSFHVHEDDEEVVDLDLIKISSEDPMAAARAAAILKLHDYDHVPNDVMRRRRSEPTAKSVARDANRRGVSAFGISKGSPWRQTRTGVVGNKVFRPGSPAISLPELLKEAEQDLERSVSVSIAGSSGFRTPVKSNSFPAASPRFVPEGTSSCEPQGIEPREWNKNDWKLLDACFTDERLDIAELQGLAEGGLADVQDVDMNNVVGRFMQMVVGNSPLEILGSSWTRENVLKRARALEKKQRAGRGAPGTPRAGTPCSDTSTQIDVPDFTPLGSHSLTMTDHSDNLKMPPTLLAPRYSHLMDEAIAISKGKEREQPPGILRRLTSPLFSYLPTLPQAQYRKEPKLSNQQGLPLPPPELFDKERDPIVTPAPKPAARPVPPKELVNLLPAPAPKPSMIPRMKTIPQRLVELRHVPRPPTPPPTQQVPSGRRSSGESVKELVKTFSKLDESTDSVGMSRSAKSINEWRTGAPSAKAAGKPKWK